MDENAAHARYRAVPHKSVNLGLGRFLIHIPGTGRRLIISAMEQAVLQQCQTNASLESSPVRLRSSNSVHATEAGHEAIAAILQDLLSKGLLVEDRRPLTSPLPPRKRDQHITSMAFVTADRPLALERSFHSYLRNFEIHDRSIAFLIMDDSRSDVARRKYLAFPESRSRDIRYCGKREKLAFIEQLARQGLDPAIASFALLGMEGSGVCTTGANRNCVLLDTAGELVLTADDDTLCSLVRHPGSDHVLRLGNHENPRDVWFCNSRTDFAQQHESDSDLLSEHESMLGHSLRELVAAMPQDRVNTEKACRHLLAGLSTDSARVVVTIPGMVGDSGAGCAQRFLLSSGRVWTKLNESEMTSRLAFTSREVLWVSRSHTITHSPHCQGAGLGIANDGLIPPFSPVGRNQDGVFGVLNLLTSTHFSGHLPVALFHDAEPTRGYEPLPPFRIANLLISLIQSFRPLADMPLEKSLGALGRYFLEIAGLPDRQFSDVLFETVSENEARTLRFLDPKKRKNPHCTAFIRQEVERYRDHIFSCLLDADCCIPTEFRGMPPGSAAAETRQLVRRTGSLLCSWPDLVEAALYLKNKEIRLSHSIVDLRD